MEALSRGRLEGAAEADGGVGGGVDVDLVFDVGGGLVEFDGAVEDVADVGDEVEIVAERVDGTGADAQVVLGDLAAGVAALTKVVGAVAPFEVALQGDALVWGVP